jgi:hypothetical protein
MVAKHFRDTVCERTKGEFLIYTVSELDRKN